MFYGVLQTTNTRFCIVNMHVFVNEQIYFSKNTLGTILYAFPTSVALVRINFVVFLLPSLADNRR